MEDFELLKENYNKIRELFDLKAVHKSHLDALFTNMRFILARFGQITSYFDAIHHQHKVEVFKGPNVAKLIEVNDLNMDSTQRVLE